MKNKKSAVRRLYVDYTRSVPVGGIRAHGGANYTKVFLTDLKKYMETEECCYEVVILWPDGYEGNSRLEKEILKDGVYHIKKIRSLEGVRFENGAVLFLPLLGIKEYPLLKKLRQQNVRLILTIHGLRLMDTKWDMYDFLYKRSCSGKIMALTEAVILLPVKRLVYRYRIRKYVSYCDAVVTVSAYTLGMLASLKVELPAVFLQYQNVWNHDKAGQTKQDCADTYMLFVSGNREEKNLARTLAAYKKYYGYNPKPLKLIVVGTEREITGNIVKCLRLQRIVRRHDLIFMPYVDDQKLDRMYQNAAFLLYTSKSEGFGLPVLEAALQLCPSVAAYGTSVPEVLGGCACYVNPFSTDSIVRGMNLMTDPVERSRYRDRLRIAQRISEDRIELSNIGLFEFLFCDKTKYGREPDAAGH